MAKVFRYLSLSDLLMIEDFKKAYAEGDEKRIKQHLYHNGMDVTQNYELNFCTHRNLRNEIVSCERFEGVERSDRTWIKSGYASIENLVLEDDFTSGELRAMSKEGFSGKWDQIAQEYVRRGGPARIDD